MVAVAKVKHKLGAYIIINMMTDKTFVVIFICLWFNDWFWCKYRGHIGRTITGIQFRSIILRIQQPFPNL